MSKEEMPHPPLTLPRLSGVHAQPLELDEPFIDLVARCAHLPGTVALLSGGDLDSARYHLLGLWPWLTLHGRAGAMHLTLEERTEPWPTTAFDALEAVLNALRLPGGGPWSAPLAAGLMGYLAYDLKDELETLPRTSVDDLGLPHMLLHAPSLLVVHDRRQGTTQIRIPLRAGAGPQTDALLARFDQLLQTPAPAATCLLPAGRLTANFTRPEYETAVRRIIDYIRAGDVYQVNLSQRFRTAFQGDAFALFRDLWQHNPAPFFAFIQAGDHQILSTSPERFILQNGRHVETRPIKGTRPRGANAEQDAALRAELAESPKDDAELSMIVDLLRNDLGKVCNAGSVRVAEHKRLEAYRNVYHLVSIVEGELEAKMNSVDLLRAVFPGGSITGCPKVRAMEIIDELEPCRRHLYCGSLGYIGFDNCMDLSIAIRTATVAGDTLCFSVGGGVVFDSDPAAEYEETLHKGRTLLAACRAAEDASGPTAIVWCNGRLLAADQAAVPIGDQGLLYGYGFFETIRVDRGRAPLLADHLKRFDASWQALMPGPAPDITWETVVAQVIAANGFGDRCAAVKLLATRGSRTAAPWDHTLLVTARPYTHRLAGKPREGLVLGTYPHVRQTPLADHKSLNYLYYLRAGQWAQAHGFDEALILNPDGTVSETNTANLLLVHGRQVVRPASAAVLPGVMAGAACRLLESWGYTIVHRPVRPEELLAADQLLAANALMGAVPVTGVDQNPRPAGDDLWRRINAMMLAPCADLERFGQ